MSGLFCSHSKILTANSLSSESSDFAEGWIGAASTSDDKTGSKAGSNYIESLTIDDLQYVLFKLSTDSIEKFKNTNATCGCKDNRVDKIGEKGALNVFDNSLVVIRNDIGVGSYDSRSKEGILQNNYLAKSVKSVSYAGSYDSQSKDGILQNNQFPKCVNSVSYAGSYDSHSKEGILQNNHLGRSVNSVSYAGSFDSRSREGIPQNKILAKSVDSVSWSSQVGGFVKQQVSDAISDTPSIVADFVLGSECVLFGLVPNSDSTDNKKGRHGCKIVKKKV